MIKANELRLGNYLQLEGENFRVSEIQNNLQCVELKRKNLENPRLNDYEECDLDCNDLLPIPLTEEWLLKFGFKLDMENFNWNAAIGENEIGDFKLALRYSERIGWFFQSKCTVLKYVHQLQNLYFAITGEELVFSTEP